jgi:putative phosphoesterase
MVVGLISDTHGLVRRAVFTALAGVELILHAGDVGGGVLEELQAIAPVRAVMGNTDDPWDPRLERSLGLDVGGVSVHVSHGHELGQPRPDALLARYDARIVLYGHTHRAVVHREGPRLAVNPGAAGPARFDVKPSVGRMTIENGSVEVEILWL